MENRARHHGVPSVVRERVALRKKERSLRAELEIASQPNTSTTREQQHEGIHDSVTQPNRILRVRLGSIPEGPGGSWHSDIVSARLPDGHEASPSKPGTMSHSSGGPKPLAPLLPGSSAGAKQNPQIPPKRLQTQEETPRKPSDNTQQATIPRGEREGLGHPRTADG